MFVDGIAYAVILLPVLAAIFIALIVLGIVLVNRRYPPYGWALPIVAGVLFFVWYEQSRNGDFNPRSEGVVEFGMLDSKNEVLNRSSYKFKYLDDNPMLITGDVVDLRFHHNGSLINFPRIGGLSNSLLNIGFADESGVSYAVFGAQHTPLTLVQALDRARNIETQFARVGVQASADDAQHVRFTVINDQGLVISKSAKSWDDAKRLLADEKLGITKMELFNLVGKHLSCSVVIENWARGGSSIYDNNFGREWGLTVSIKKD